jgi:lysine biosynthesis protein LysW
MATTFNWPNVRAHRTAAAVEGECMATCPECDAEIEIDEDDLEEMEVGDPWDCDACATRLRVVTLDPLDFETDDDDDDDEAEVEKAEGDADEVDDAEDPDEEDSEDWEE